MEQYNRQDRFFYEQDYLTLNDYYISFFESPPSSQLRLAAVPGSYVFVNKNMKPNYDTKGVNYSYSGFTPLKVPAIKNDFHQPIEI